VKTKTRRTKKTTKPFKLNVPSPKPPTIEKCSHCGGVAVAGWINWDTMKRYWWCGKCREIVQKSAPKEVADNYAMKDTPRASLAVYYGPNEIELVLHGKGPAPHSVIKGRNARICYDAWTESIFDTDHIKIDQLYHIAPRARYLIYDTNGRLCAKAKRYDDAETLAGKHKVIVWWGGR
jgi:ribosomal protein S27AE